MRYIDIEKLKLPDGWEDRAKALTEELKACVSHEERKAILDAEKNRIWKELKDGLAELSSDKCWYSEAKSMGASKDVDHFRPKGKSVDKDGAPYEGYWWLAYVWRNYRLSSQYANQLRTGADGVTRGKHHHFPLRVGSFRAKQPTDDLRLESHYLLDPIRLQDVDCLTFDDMGNAISSYQTGTWEYERAAESIEKYHLNYHRFVGAREKLWKETQRKVNRIAFILAKPNKDQADSDTIEELLKELREMSTQDAEFSGAVKASLESCSERWARKIVSL